VDTERAETHLRLLAEAELRRAATSDRELLGPAPGLARLSRVARALTTLGALDTDTADTMLAGFELAPLHLQIVPPLPRGTSVEIIAARAARKSGAAP
jgi:hypothetical protein